MLIESQKAVVTQTVKQKTLLTMPNLLKVGEGYGKGEANGAWKGSFNGVCEGCRNSEDEREWASDSDKLAEG